MTLTALVPYLKAPKITHSQEQVPRIEALNGPKAEGKIVERRLELGSQQIRIRNIHERRVSYALICTHDMRH